MKNILGKTENLSLYNKEGKKVYDFYTYPNGYSSEHTYGENDIPLTFKDSHGVSIDFDIPEYTMEELIEKLGNFKINK